MGGNSLEDIPDPQHQWGQRALATSRTQQHAFKDQWELIVENGDRQARAIADLKKELELIRGDVSSQRGELTSCTTSIACISQVQTKLEHYAMGLEKQYQVGLKSLEDQVLEAVETKLKEQEHVRLALDANSRSTEVWADLKKEQYDHEIYMQDMLRRVNGITKEQDARTISMEEHVDRLEKELRAFMKEHDLGVVNGKEELCRFCSAIKTGLDARVTCLHERVSDFEKGLDAHVDWVQGELRQLHVLNRHEYEASFRETAIRVEKELDMHVNWVQGELQCLHSAVKVMEDNQADCLGQASHREWVRGELRQLSSIVKEEHEARLSSVQNWASRIDERLESQRTWLQDELRHMERPGELLSQVAQCEQLVDGHMSWMKSELLLLGQSTKDGLENANSELRRLDLKLEGVQQSTREERQEEGRRCARLETLLSELDKRLLRAQDDLRGHWHKLTVTEHVQCGPAEPRCAATCGSSPERTWEDADQSTRADDDVVISSSALFGASPVRTELPSVLESAQT